MNAHSDDLKSLEAQLRRHEAPGAAAWARLLGLEGAA